MYGFHWVLVHCPYSVGSGMSCQCLLKQDQTAEGLRQIAGLSQAEEALLDKQHSSWKLLKPGAEDREGLRQPSAASRSAIPMTSG